jgi:nucleotidyltransferase substrate binding protein (TIGR01987 family)
MVSETNYDKFRDSLSRLEERYNYYLQHKDNILFSLEMQESIKESCIQRFEVCFDTTHKHLKKYLEDEGYSNVPDSPKQKFRLASQNHLLEAELWIEFNKKRGDTSHDYCGDKADGTFEIIPDFIKEAIGLYEIMSGVKWQN